MGDGPQRVLRPEAFAGSSWLHAVGEPLRADADSFGNIAAIRRYCEDDPDVFFRPPYTPPYEDWCVADHNAAARLPAELRDQAQTVARRAYLRAWDVLPSPELCGLVSDDVLTIYSLLLLNSHLSEFTVQRASWLVAGRVPWGYTGDFPAGRWLVL